MNDAVGRIERGPYGAQVSLAVPVDSQEIPYQLETLIVRRPKALLPVYRQVSAAGARYSYPVTGLSTLAELTTQKRLSRKQASALFRQIHELTVTLPDHLLSPEQLLFRPDLLFIRQPEWDIQVVYQPFLPLIDPYGELELLDWLAESAIRIPQLKDRWKRLQYPAEVNVANSGSPDRPLDQQAARQKDKPATGLASIVSFGLAIIQLLVLITTLLTVWQLPGWPLTMKEVSRPLILFFVLTILIQGLLLAIPKASKMEQAGASDLPGSRPEAADHGLGLSAMRERLTTLASSANPIKVLQKARANIADRSERSKANPERVREMPTELLSNKQALFRLATLSEGMIGTAGEMAGQRAFILTEEFIIGRDSRIADLCLTGYAVGRQHARISRKGATFFITDLGSKNGTRLNGERLNKLVEYRLPDRCQIEFADRPFYFEAEELLEPLPPS